MTLRQWIEQEPFTLSLSSGFFGFFAHSGFLSVLEEEGLRPEKITGCSAGALVGALWASGMTVEELMDLFQSVEKKDFWDPGLGLGLLKGGKFRGILTHRAAVMNLEDCSIPVAVSTCQMSGWKNRVFTRGSLPHVVYASCAIPPLFQPVRIDGRLYWDGAFTDRPGLAGVDDNARVLYNHLEARSDQKKRKDILGAHRHRLDLVKIQIPDLPEVHPNRLHLGSIAYDVARNEMRQLLDRPVEKESSH